MKRRRFGSLKTKDKEFEVDITSLLDILVILLVFLLKSYNASDLKLDVVKKIELPKSNSEKLGHMAAVIQVDEDQNVWLNKDKIGVLQGKSKKIDFLYEKLTEYKKLQKDKIEELKELAKTDLDRDAIKTREKGLKKVNIVMEQSLKYETLGKIMHTAALAEYPEFKFIVQGNF